MKRFCLLILLVFCINSVLHAQPGYSGFQFHVSDSISRIPLPGVSMLIISGRDTSRTVTNERGEVRHQALFRTDTVEVLFHHIGYEPKQLFLRAPPQGRTQGVMVALVPSAEEIAEIIVVGERVAVVMKGDTVQFNAEAFKTFVNDPMSKLFEILPGIAFENGTLSYLGETIHRITIDGKPLFGDHVDLALGNIRADDVEDVRVFKTVDDQDVLDDPDDRRQITVADVRTKSKPSMIRNTTLTAGGGSGLDPGHRDGERQGLYDLAGDLVFSRVGESLSAGARTDNFMASNPTDFGRVIGNLLYTREEADRFKISTTNNASISKDIGESGTVRNYFPTDAYGFRHHNARSSSVNKRQNYYSDNRLQYSLPGSSFLGANANFSYGEHVSEGFNRTLVRQDAELLQNQQLSSWGQDAPYRIATRVTFSKGLRNGRINTDIFANISGSDGRDWRVDTLPSSTAPLYLERQSRARSQDYGGKVSVSFRPAPNLYVTLSDELSLINSLSRRHAVDMLAGMVDPVNSYDFQIAEVKNHFRGGVSYTDHQKAKGISLASVDFTWQHRNEQRDERFPADDRLQRAFNLLGGTAKLEYNLGGFNVLKLGYTRSSTAPALQDFRELDDSNPLMLLAGNPDLKQTASNSFSGSGIFVKGSSTYEFSTEFVLQENLIVNKAHYFPEETYLPQYDYWALAGSTLVTRENRDGRRIFRAGGKHSVRSGTLAMIIRSALNYGYYLYPTYLYEQAVINQTHQYRASLGLTGNFSSRLVPSLTAYTSYNDRLSEGIQHRWLEQKLELNVRAMLSRSVELNSTNDFQWNAHWPTVVGMERFGVRSNISVDYLFDDRGDFRLKVEVRDALNRRPRTSISVGDEYISESFAHFLGRSGMIRLEYRF